MYLARWTRHCLYFRTNESTGAISPEYPCAKCERARRRWRGSERKRDGFYGRHETRKDRATTRERRERGGSKKRCSWDSLPPHYSVCSSISRREMAKARAPLFLRAFDNPRRYLVSAELEPRADSRGCHSSAASQLPLLCHLAFVYRISSACERRERERERFFYRALVAIWSRCATICSFPPLKDSFLFFFFNISCSSLIFL